MEVKVFVAHAHPKIFNMKRFIINQLVAMGKPEHVTKYIGEYVRLK